MLTASVHPWPSSLFLLTIRRSPRNTPLDYQVEYAVDKQGTDVVPGTLDMLILKTLSLAPMHAFGIARRVEQISRDVFKVNAGSLLVALQRLERAGWLDAEWRETENKRQGRFYSLTRAGRKQLDVETAAWERRVSAISRLLKAEA